MFVVVVVADVSADEKSQEHSTTTFWHLIFTALGTWARLSQGIHTAQSLTSINIGHKKENTEHMKEKWFENDGPIKIRTAQLCKFLYCLLLRYVNAVLACSARCSVSFSHIAVLTVYQRIGTRTKI